MKKLLITGLVLVASVTGFGQAVQVLTGVKSLEDLLRLRPSELVRTVRFVEYGLTPGDQLGGMYKYFPDSVAATNEYRILKPESFDGRWVKLMPWNDNETDPGVGLMFLLNPTQLEWLEGNTLQIKSGATVTNLNVFEGLYVELEQSGNPPTGPVFITSKVLTGTSKPTVYIESYPQSPDSPGNDHWLFHADNSATSVSGGGETPVLSVTGTVGGYFHAGQSRTNTTEMGIIGEADGSARWKVGTGGRVTALNSDEGRNAGIYGMIRGGTATNHFSAAGIFEARRNQAPDVTTAFNHNESAVLVLEARGTGWPLIVARKDNGTNTVFRVNNDSGYTGAGTLFLSDDGTYKEAGGSGGDSLWTNFGTYIAPSGFTNDVKVFQNGSIFLGIPEAGYYDFNSNATRSLLYGSSENDIDTISSDMVYRTTELGASEVITSIDDSAISYNSSHPVANNFSLQVSNPLDGAVTTFSTTGTTSARSTYLIANVGENQHHQIRNYVSGVSAFTTWLANDVEVARINPTSSDGNTPYIFNTSILHESGNLAEIKNNGTNAFTVAAVSGYTGAGTLFLSDDGTYKSGGGGTTINPTDGFIPYRVDSTTFGNSPLQVAGADHIMIQGSDSSIITTGLGLQSVQAINIAGSNPIGLYGFSANNIAAATSGVQQNSPGVMWGGQGWSTNNAVSESITFGAYIIPSAGADHPSGQLTFRYQITSTNAVQNAAAFDTSTTSGQTRFLIYDVDNGTLERVSVGAPDSGGSGFKVLRIPN